MRTSGVLHKDVEILVPFFDVDSMHVVWHGHYVKYLEVARCALLDKIGHNYNQMVDSGYAWPVIDLQLRYVRGAVFGQRLNVRAQDTPEIVRRRMLGASNEIQHWQDYDYVVINYDIGQSVAALRAILTAERLRRMRLTGLKDFVQDLQAEL